LLKSRYGSEEGNHESAREAALDFEEMGYVDWKPFEALRKEAFLFCSDLGDLKGRRVRITIEVLD